MLRLGARSLDVVEHEAVASDPLSNVVVHPNVVATIRNAERRNASLPATSAMPKGTREPFANEHWQEFPPEVLWQGNRRSVQTLPTSAFGDRQSARHRDVAQGLPVTCKRHNAMKWNPELSEPGRATVSLSSGILSSALRSWQKRKANVRGITCRLSRLYRSSCDTHSGPAHRRPPKSPGTTGQIPNSDIIDVSSCRRQYATSYISLKSRFREGIWLAGS
jgi:hypothetical protein